MNKIINFTAHSYISALAKYDRWLKEQGFKIEVEATSVSVINDEIQLLVTYFEQECEL